MGFTKLFSDIVASSIWNEDDKTRIVWITLLAMKGPNNIARASVDGLAHQARVSIDDCKKALEKLSGPDPYSGDPEFEGRRVEKVNHGWLILNGQKYQMRRDEEDRKEYMTTYMRQYRRKEPAKESTSESVTESVNKSVNKCELGKPLLKNVTDVSPSEEDKKKNKEKEYKEKEKETSLRSLDGLQELKSRIGGWFKRRPTTVWTEKEMKSLRIQRNAAAEDLDALEGYYTASIPKESDWRRHDVLTLLNNFPGEVDRARAFMQKHQSRVFKPVVVEERRQATPEEIAASRELFAGTEFKTKSGRASNGSHP